MKIVLVHHHLNRGGVTQVIANQLRSVNESLAANHRKAEAFVFFGGRKTDWPDDLPLELGNLAVQLIEVNGLDYAELESPACSLADSFSSKLTDLGLTREDCVIHVHNHSLGKSWALVETVNRLLDDGFRVLFQIHDFAEDSRPDNYRLLKSSAAKTSSSLSNWLYPQNSHSLYGVINRRDAQFLETQGIDNQQIRYLPNAVSPVEIVVDPSTARQNLQQYAQIDSSIPFWVYPVRGIRRKNIGEVLLLSVLADSAIQFGLTLPPLNPQEAVAYSQWKRLATDLRLPVFFELGKNSKISFPEILSSADAILTTSIAEGFGMVFLESFAVGKQLVGRDLPEITIDFIEAGIRFDGLYDVIRIPIEMVFLNDYRTSIELQLRRCFDSYEKSFDSNLVDEQVQQSVDLGWIDFGKLPGAIQMDVVRSVFRRPDLRAKILSLNSPVANILEGETSSKYIESNQRIVEERFSPGTIGKQLMSIYEELAHAPSKSIELTTESNRLVDCFLNPERFFPIRFETELEFERPEEKWRDLILQSSPTLLPIPTDVDPRLISLDGIQLVLFDIYGTLLVSSSGDVGTDEKFENEDHQSGSARLLEMLTEMGHDLGSADLSLRNEIMRQHELARLDGIPFPEIDIVEIWKKLIDSNPANRTNPDLGSRAWIEELALRYELVSNPVFPMPGMKSIVEMLLKKGIKLGIISNAQFYTPMIVESFWGKSLEQIGFDRRLSFFSYCFGKGKPDVFLYQSAAQAVNEMGCHPDQVLYIGNDFRKDVRPANQVGFRTGLFAGDQRSLRLGEQSLPLDTNLVDLILTELTQIDECISQPT